MKQIEIKMGSRESLLYPVAENKSILEQDPQKLFPSIKSIRCQLTIALSPKEPFVASESVNCTINSTIQSSKKSVSKTLGNTWTLKKKSAYVPIIAML